MTDIPRVSVIIPTYNRSAVLRHAITSVLAQTFTDFELLVVGDCCTDDSAAVVAGFADPRIRWFNLPANSGHQSGPNNEGLRQAKGELIAYLGHDDLWLPHHLQVLVAAIDGGADMVGGLTEMVAPEGRLLEIAPPQLNYRAGFWMPPSALMHRRSLTVRIGGWRDYRELTIYPEADLIARAVTGGARLEIVARLTAVKFPAGWRKNVYRIAGGSEQAAWLARMAGDPEFERHEMARLIYAGKNGQMRRERPYRQLWLDLARETQSRIAARLQSLRIYLAGSGARIDSDRRYKGLDCRR